MSSVLYEAAGTRIQGDSGRDRNGRTNQEVIIADIGCGRMQAA
jgi:hypothetical protein